MSCIRCELTRSKLIALTMDKFGYSWLDIINKLNASNPGNQYFIEQEGLEANPRHVWLKRENAVPPHVPYVILERII